LWKRGKLCLLAEQQQAGPLRENSPCFLVRGWLGCGGLPKALTFDLALPDPGFVNRQSTSCCKGKGMPKRNDPSDTQEPTFEEALKEIEQITRALESGELGLEESLKLYERGVMLLRRCYHLLQTAETRVEMLMGFDAKGSPITEPFSPTGEQAESPLDNENSEKGGRK
jgi:exodeoxyribonuclease VII small subunit